MSWSGKFKNGESFTDLSDDELNRFESEVDPSSVSENVESKLPELPPVPADTQSDISVVGFANPTTPAKAQAYVASQEPGYFENALNYARGDEQEDPNLLGEVWKGASQSALYEHPFETGAGIAAGVFAPMSLGALGQMGVTGASVGAGNILDQALLDSDTTRSWQQRASETAGSAAGAGMLSGLGYGIASGMKNYAAPYMKAVKDYAAKTKVLEQFKSWLENAPIKSAVAEIRATKKLFPGSSDVDQMVRDQAEMKLQELIDNKMIGKDVLETMYQDPDAAEAIANLVSRKMQNELPEYNVFGPMTAGPSTGEVGRYILENTQAPKAVIPSEHILPEWASRYAQRAFPGVTAAADVVGAGRMVRGLADQAVPRILPSIDYLAPAVSKGLGSAGGVTGGILGSEGVRSIQDLQSRREMPPVF